MNLDHILPALLPTSLGDASGRIAQNIFEPRGGTWIGDAAERIARNVFAPRQGLDTLLARQFPPGSATKYLDSTGAWTVPAGSGITSETACPLGTLNLKITRDEGGSPNTKVKLVPFNTNVLANYQATLQDASTPKNNYKVDQSSTITIDAGSTGANGLDTGTQASSTWYYIWLIYNGTTVAGLLSTSSTAPTMPGGYTYKLLVSAVYSDGSTHFVAFTQWDRYVTIATTNVFTAAAGHAGWTSQSVSTIVPPTAKLLLGAYGLSTAPGASAAYAISIASDSNGTGEQLQAIQANAAVFFESYLVGAAFRVLMATAQTFYWKTGDNESVYRVDVVGWEY